MPWGEQGTVGSPTGLRHLGPRRNWSSVTAHAWQRLSCCQGFEEGSPHQDLPRQGAAAAPSAGWDKEEVTGPQEPGGAGEEQPGGAHRRQAKQEPHAGSQNPGERNASPPSGGLQGDSTPPHMPP